MAKKTWRNSGCYLWRTRKPSAFLGLPFIGRHNAYVGETSSRYFRDNQHLYGDSRYGTAAKPWSDLDPKAYPLPCLFPGWKWARKAQETIWIWLLCPVYNDRKQPPYNVRRIRPIKAQQQRWARQKTGIKVNVTRVAARYALALVIFAGATYSAWEAWIV